MSIRRTFVIFNRQKICQHRPQVFPLSGFTLPNRSHTPTQLFEIGDIALISIDVRRELVFPKGTTRSGNRRHLASVVAMPEASVHENDQSMPRKYDVRAARQILAMKTETISQ